MLPKPKHLGIEYASQFKDQSIADAYPNRPPYPAGVFPILASLIVNSPRIVLDIGCGQSPYKFLLDDKKTKYFGITTLSEILPRWNYNNKDLSSFRWIMT